MDANAIASFFSRVVPWPTPDRPGFVNLHWFPPKKPDAKYVAAWGRPFTSISDFMNGVEWYKAHPDKATDIYFCTSAQRTCTTVTRGNGTTFLKADREAKDAVAMKAIWFDIDVKNKEGCYKTLDEARDGLANFLAASGMPGPSAVVASGGGLHVYWISDRPLTPNEWLPYATGLRNLAERHGLRCDLGLTTDMARILRVPGTLNRKYDPPKPVKLIGLSEKDINFSDTLSWIKDENARVRIIERPSAPTNLIKFTGPANFDLGEDLHSQEYQAEIGEVRGNDELDIAGLLSKEGCPMFRAAAETKGAKVPQSLWHLQALACSFIKDGRTFFHAISSGYPSYQKEEADAMFDRKEEERYAKELGWPSCKAFASGGSTQCASCIHRNRINSPLNLTRQFKPPSDVEDLVALPRSPLVGTGPTPSEDPLRLPKDYLVYGPERHIWRKDGKGGAQAFLLFEVKDPWVQRDTGLHFWATARGQEPIRMILRKEDLHSAQAIQKALAAKLLGVNSQLSSHLVNFMNYWIDQLRTKPDTEAVPYGWYLGPEGNGFAYDGTIYLRQEDTKEVKQLPAGYGDPETQRHYSVKGEIQPWMDALKSLTDQHRPGLEVMVALAFAGPLIHLTGKSGATLAAYGRGAANKSSAAMVGLAVWGDPEQTKRRPDTTVNSLFGTTGDLRNIPLYWDDVHDDDAIKNALKVASTLTEGGDKARMNADLTQRRTKIWQTMICIAANKNILDQAVLVSKSDSAKVMRIFQIEIPKADENTPGRMQDWEASPIFDKLRHNYGGMGKWYAEFIGTNYFWLKDQITKEMETLGKEIEVKDDERFWLATCACLLMGAKIANKKGATFNILEMWDYLKRAWIGMREKIAGEALEGGTEENTQKALVKFLGQQGSSTLRSGHVKTKRGRGQIDPISFPERWNGNAMTVHWVMLVSPPELRLSKGAFTRYLEDAKYNVSATVSGLKHFFGAQTIRATLAGGCKYGSANGQETVYVIPVTKDWLLEMMNTYNNVTEGVQDGDA